MNKTFKVAQVRGLLNQVKNEQITFSRFVEILNEGQSSPKIKKLEWEKSGGEYWEAITPIGAYSITLDFGIYEALYDMDNDVDGEWGSLAKAKAAAQRDFEKRINECLE